MQLYRERLWPSAWVFAATALVIPASLLVFLPISPTAGQLTAALLYAGCVAALIATSPVIEVTGAEVTAGRARLPIAYAGVPEAFEKEEATLQRGQRLDARAWLVIRGWISPVVKIPVTDAADPAPYWLVSTRRPAALAAAILEARSGAGTAPHPG